MREISPERKRDCHRAQTVIDLVMVLLIVMLTITSCYQYYCRGKISTTLIGIAVISYIWLVASAVRNWRLADLITKS